MPRGFVVVLVGSGLLLGGMADPRCALPLLAVVGDGRLVNAIVEVGVELVLPVAGLGGADDSGAEHAPRVLLAERGVLRHVGADDVDEAGAVALVPQHADPRVVGVERKGARRSAHREAPAIAKADSSSPEGKDQNRYSISILN